AEGKVGEGLGQVFYGLELGKRRRPSPQHPLGGRGVTADSPLDTTRDFLSRLGRSCLRDNQRASLRLGEGNHHPTEVQLLYPFFGPTADVSQHTRALRLQAAVQGPQVQPNQLSSPLLYLDRLLLPIKRCLQHPV